MIVGIHVKHLKRSHGELRSKGVKLHGDLGEYEYT